MKAKIRRLLKSITEDKSKGLVISHRDSVQLQGIWLQLFGVGGCSHYPYVTQQSMVEDLEEVFK